MGEFEQKREPGYFPLCFKSFPLYFLCDTSDCSSSCKTEQLFFALPPISVCPSYKGPMLNLRNLSLILDNDIGSAAPHPALWTLCWKFPVGVGKDELGISRRPNGLLESVDSHSSEPMLGIGEDVISYNGYELYALGSQTRCTLRKSFCSLQCVIFPLSWRPRIRWRFSFTMVQFHCL